MKILKLVRYRVTMTAFMLVILVTSLAGQNMPPHEAITAMISAHGGLEKWRSMPTISFEDSFKQSGEQEPLVSHVTVEQGRRRAYIDFPNLKAAIAWDGKQAWSQNWKSPLPPRFLALLNFYFLNLPWLTMDRGVNLAKPSRGKLWNDATEYITVKMTFDPGTGDTPDDYYVLYIDPKTKRLRACEYVATYAAILPSGAKSSPVNILVYENFTTVDGLVVPTRYTIYDRKRSVLATCDIRNWSFRKKFDETRMTIPPGAVIDKSSPER